MPTVVRLKYFDHHVNVDAETGTLINFVKKYLRTERASNDASKGESQVWLGKWSAITILNFLRR